MLMEVLRKAWTGLIVRRIIGALLKHRVLCPSQHAYLPSRGTDTANIQLLNTLEDSWSTLFFIRQLVGQVQGI